MSDIANKNRTLIIKRHEHAKLVALGQIQAKEIRIMELEEEIERCKQDIESQGKVISVAEKNISDQLSEIDKEKILN